MTTTGDTRGAAPASHAHDTPLARRCTKAVCALALAGGLALAGAAAAQEKAAGGAADLKLLEPGTEWKFGQVNAAGTFTLGTDGGKAVGTLAYDFTKDLTGQRYVLASVKTELQGLGGISFKARASQPQKVTFRVVDGTDQTFQYKTQIKGTGDWEALSFSLTKKTEHWGGANDGVLHFPIKGLVVSLPMMADGPKNGKVDFADFAGAGGKTDGAPAASGGAPAAASAPEAKAPGGTADLKLLEPGTEWKFGQVNAAGTFTLGTDGGKAVGTLAYDFTKDLTGQRYVLASVKTELQGLGGISFKARASQPQKVTFRVVDGTDQTFQYKTQIKGTGDWEALSFSLTKKTEHWGGANDGVLHFPIKGLVVSLPMMADGPKTGKVDFADFAAGAGGKTAGSASAPSRAPVAAGKTEYGDFNYSESGAGDPGVEWVQAISVQTPAYRSEVKGDVKVAFTATGMVKAKVSCWQQPTKEDPNPWGHDVDVADFELDVSGTAAFVFPADRFPNGPLTLRIYAQDRGARRDLCQLQLFNKGGEVWNQGIPKTDPPAAKGMKLVFADDFDGPLSISKDGKGTKYGAHTPWHGDFSGWPFADAEGPDNPFSQMGTFLRIRASKTEGGKGAAGLLSSVGMDGTGFTAKAPCYFECRFVAQSAIGTWPAFWLSTNRALPKGTPSDELDIVEAYGGLGKGNPNHPGYSLTSHFWKQNGPDGKPLAPINKRVPMTELGGKSYWSTTFHTYAVKITETDTVYYLDDIEVMRHPSGEISKTQPHLFLINYAIGGISRWPIDLTRYGNATDMYVDYVRVYQGG